MTTPTLTGSEKQIAWAAQIRRTFVENLEATARRRSKFSAEKAALFEKVVGRVLAETRASAWIAFGGGSDLAGIYIRALAAGMFAKSEHSAFIAEIEAVG